MALVVAHRGGPGLGPTENTLEAFLRAAEVGAPMAELDVRRTADGVLAVYHDEGIDGVLLGELTYGDLCARAAGHGFRPPTLEEVMAACRGRIRLDIELKESGYEPEIIALLEACGEPETAVLKSFDLAACAALAALRPELTLGYLIDSDYVGFPEAELRSVGASFVGPAVSLVDHAFMDAARAAGVEVWVWTLHTAEEMSHLLDLGVHALITDEPHIALDLVAQR